MNYLSAQSSSWPGERDPSHQDVASASERPDPTLLSDFKRALLASSDAIGTEKLFHMDLRNHIYTPTKKYTYPVALLSRFPRLPADDRLSHLSRAFYNGCLDHVFFRQLPVSAVAREPLAPPLRFAIACLGSVCSGGDAEEGRSIYQAGASLWPVMVEVDNGLARSIEMLLAAALLIPYGVLAAEEPLQRRSALIISSSLTIARRMQLHNPGRLDPGIQQRILSYSPMLWLLWLWDVLQAVHSNLSLNFSPDEISTNMPSSNIPFQDVYRNLLQGPSVEGQTLLSTMGASSREQAILLLLAILSDSITLRRTLGSAANVINSVQITSYKHNPFVPLSAHTELERMQSRLSKALDQWYINFSGSMSPDVIAFFHYCRLYLSCPEISSLSRLAQYDISSNQHQILASAAAATNTIDISSQSLDHAWALLDVVAACQKSDGILCQAWMPIIVFHAALVVWAKVSFSTGGDRDTYGSRRVLLAFKMELETMHWPCCTKMAMTLQRLMSA
ncbi:hypothetical protein F5Y00DRAFT_246641 [Daldinia vernicosa]|uniref:uncharacterized protein n=1 Tax=Daldinia vernicosa TaxID=114800 RepID=UPI00200800E3|nr:uncharacterized protein F5Y00DRAFT_246641 [Daldinia vernicosa]KAI0845334.1 hypothetical protein F5Y00DRAFT_246641 [Daldinia vernicosa]